MVSLFDVIISLSTSWME